MESKMLKECKPDELFSIVASSFETLAFMEVFPASAESFNLQNSICASVQFEKPEPGGYALYLPRALAKDLARNSMGEMEISENLLKDVVGEACNVIGGRAASQEGVLLLSSPEICMSNCTIPSGAKIHYFQSNENCFALANWKGADCGTQRIENNPR
jgi:Chemotaxis phosphatase CheX